MGKIFLYMLAWGFYLCAFVFLVMGFITWNMMNFILFLVFDNIGKQVTQILHDKL